MTTRIEGFILTSRGFVRASLEQADGRITVICGSPTRRGASSLKGKRLLPLPDIRMPSKMLAAQYAVPLHAGPKQSVAVDALKNAEGLFVIGRGTRPAIAQEAALKFKHGPMARVDEGYPVLVFAPGGPAQAGLLALAEVLVPARRLNQDRPRHQAKITKTH